MSEQPDQASTQPSRKKPLGFDEMIAILVAFGAIGSILFWGLTRQPEELALIGESLNPTVASPAEGLLSPQGSAFTIVSPTVQAPIPVAKPSAVAQGNVPATVQSNASVQPNVSGTVSPTQPNRVNNGNFIGAVLPAVVPAAGVVASGAAPASPAPTASPATPIAAVTSFPDVPPDYWARPFIEGLAKRGIAVGSPDGTFRPEQSVTRAEYAVLVQKAFDQPESQGAIAFTDIPANFWATPAIDGAVKQGFLKGYPDGGFQPNKEVSRLQVLLSLVNGLGLPRPEQPEVVLTLFQDRAQIPEWAVPAAGTAAESNIVVNYPALDQLKPDQPTTRAEVAALIYQALVASGKAESISSEYIVNP
ncbi:MAG: S-layer homology domain-containing protein [Timaviella obliquedivisa GSE-PSE-MK23-08B]|nr:S-layer homology domain-containing protein [Timaviella obliquedivisa GSE-PSE-MK23-08B]